MKLINRTPYSARDLRRILVATYRDVEEQKGKLRTWDLRTFSGKHSMHITVTVANGKWRNRPYGGRAALDGYWIKLRVPTPEITIVKLVALMRHELWHSYGAEHPDYPPGVMYCVPSDRDRAIVERLGLGETLSTTAPKAAPVVDLVQERYDRLLERETLWESKLKRAQQALAKIRGSKRGYERRIAARTPSKTV